MSGRGRYVVRRLIQTVPLLLGVLLLVSLLLQVTPGDPARTVAGKRASEAELEQVREQLGLNESFAEQYVTYVGNAVQGDLGTSIRRGAPVTEVTGEGLPVTLALLACGCLLSIMLAVPLAQWAADRQDRFVDHAIRGFSVVTLTMPAFFIGILLLVLVALPTGWFPVSGYGETIAEHARALVLPSITLAVALAPLLIRSMRAEFIAIRESDYLAMARASGVSGRRLLFKHEVPNAILPAITITSVSIGYLLFAIVVVENTFGLPGLGQIMVNAVADKDFPLVQGITLLFALIVISVYLVADLLYAWIDPRVVLK